MRVHLEEYRSVRLLVADYFVILYDLKRQLAKRGRLGYFVKTALALTFINRWILDLLLLI